MYNQIILAIKSIYQSKHSNEVKKEIINALVLLKPNLLNDEYKSIYKVYMSHNYTQKELRLTPQLKAIKEIIFKTSELISDDEFKKRCYLELLNFFFNGIKGKKHRYNSKYYLIYLSLIEEYQILLDKYLDISSKRKEARAKRKEYKKFYVTKDKRITRSKTLENVEKEYYEERFKMFWNILPKGFKVKKETCKKLFIGDQIINASEKSFEEFMNDARSYYLFSTDKPLLDSYFYLSLDEYCHSFNHRVQIAQIDILSKNPYAD